MEGSEGLGKKSSEQGKFGSPRVPWLGGWIHPGQRVSNVGSHLKGGRHHFGTRQQRNIDEMAGK